MGGDWQSLQSGHSRFTETGFICNTSFYTTTNGSVKDGLNVGEGTGTQLTTGHKFEQVGGVSQGDL